MSERLERFELRKAVGQKITAMFAGDNCIYIAFPDGDGVLLSISNEGYPVKAKLCAEALDKATMGRVIRCRTREFEARLAEMGKSTNSQI